MGRRSVFSAVEAFEEFALAFGLVSATDKSGRLSVLGKIVGEPTDEGRFADAAEGEVADGDRRTRRVDGAEDAEVVKAIAETNDGGIRERNEGGGGSVSERGGRLSGTVKPSARRRVKRFLHSCRKIRRSKELVRGA